MIQIIENIEDDQSFHTIYVLNGPNLQLLGKREPYIYGYDTLQDLEVLLNDNLQYLQLIRPLATIVLEMFQTNHEGEMLDFISDAFLKHQARQNKLNTVSCIINMGAWTHTSIALRDALSASAFKFVEVHLSNIYQRESFRQHSYFSDNALGLISGLGIQGYAAALEYLVNWTDVNIR